MGPACCAGCSADKVVLHLSNMRIAVGCLRLPAMGALCVLFEDAHIMFLEVANPPGLDVRMHGHPYPSVFARDTGGGAGAGTGAARGAGVPIDDTHLDPGSIFAGKGWGDGGPPEGLPFLHFRKTVPCHTNPR